MADSEEQIVSEPLVIECSREGAVLVEVGCSGEQVRVQLEPEALAWPMEVLGDRIVRLYRVAMMRARADHWLSENYGLMGIPRSNAWPTHAEVDEFRRSAIDF